MIFQFLDLSSLRGYPQFPYPENVLNIRNIELYIVDLLKNGRIKVVLGRYVRNTAEWIVKDAVISSLSSKLCNLTLLRTPQESSSTALPNHIR